MHDLLEGLLPFEVKEMFKVFTDCKILTHKEIYSVMESFPYDGSDIPNKPTPVARCTLTSSDHLLKQTGDTLYLPFSTAL